MRRSVVLLFILLIAANLGAWAWALVAFRHYPLLLGTGLLAYGLGLRHAIDADHIAAIDNVTRKLMQDGQRPVTVGFFFSLGHSTVVVLASLAIAATATALADQPRSVPRRRRHDRTTVSVVFLLAIAVMNLLHPRVGYRAFHRVKNGGTYVEEDLDTLLAGGGLLARIFRPLSSASFARVGTCTRSASSSASGFDTATEIALLGISAAEAARGMPIWSIMVFPRAVHRGHVAGRHRRQRVDGRRLRVGVHQAD